MQRVCAAGALTFNLDCWTHSGILEGFLLLQLLLSLDQGLFVLADLPLLPPFKHLPSKVTSLCSAPCSEGALGWSPEDQVSSHSWAVTSPPFRQSNRGTIPTPMAWTLFPASSLARHGPTAPQCSRTKPQPSSPVARHDCAFPLLLSQPSDISISIQFLFLDYIYTLLLSLNISGIFVHSSTQRTCLSLQLGNVLSCRTTTDYMASPPSLCPGNPRPVAWSPCFAQSSSSGAILNRAWDFVCIWLW